MMYPHYRRRALEKRLSVSIDTETHRALKVCAAIEDRSMNAVVLDAVKEYLKQRCKNDRQ